MGEIAIAWDVDGLVTAIYREAGEDAGAPPGMGALAKAFFRPKVHLVFEEGDPEQRGTLVRDADEWVIHLKLLSKLHRPCDRPAIGFGLALVLAHEALIRWGGQVDERELAEAIVLPTPALHAWEGRSAQELAEYLVTTPGLVESRRRRFEPSSSPRLRAAAPAPLAKAAAAKVLDLAAVRAVRARRQRSL